MKEYMDERKSGNTKVYIVLLGVALIIALLWVTGLIRWADSSKEQEMQVINTEVPQGQVADMLQNHGGGSLIHSNDVQSEIM